MDISIPLAIAGFVVIGFLFVKTLKFVAWVRRHGVANAIRVWAATLAGVADGIDRSKVQRRRYIQSALRQSRVQEA